MKRILLIFIAFFSCVASAAAEIEARVGYLSEYTVENGLLFDPRASVPVREFEFDFSGENFFFEARKSEGLETLRVPTPFPGITLPVPGIGDEERVALGWRSNYHRWNWETRVERMEIGALKTIEGIDGITALKLRLEKQNSKSFGLSMGLDVYFPDNDEMLGALYIGAGNRGNFRLFGGGAFAQDLRFIYDEDPITDYRVRIEWELSNGFVLELPALTYTMQGDKAVQGYGMSLSWRR